MLFMYPQGERLFYFCICSLLVNVIILRVYFYNYMQNTNGRKPQLDSKNVKLSETKNIYFFKMENSLFP